MQAGGAAGKSAGVDQIRGKVVEAAGVELGGTRFSNSLTGRRLWSKLLTPKELASIVESPPILVNLPKSTRFVEKWWRRREWRMNGPVAKWRRDRTRH
jgi:hypothetical protein